MLSRLWWPFSHDYSRFLGFQKIFLHMLQSLHSKAGHSAKLEEMEKENSKNKKIHDQFNQDIDELGRETESLVEEIDKWQT